MANLLFGAFSKKTGGINTNARFADQSDMAGILKKRSPSKKIFQKRYFWIMNKHLFYAKVKGAHEPKGAIPLKFVQDVAVSNPPKHHQFQFKMSDRIWQFQASSDTMRDSWIDAIAEGARTSQLRRNTETTPTSLPHEFWRDPLHIREALRGTSDATTRKKPRGVNAVPLSPYINSASGAGSIGAAAAAAAALASTPVAGNPFAEALAELAAEEQKDMNEEDDADSEGE